MKIIAYYLPQYHEIEENNEWWGTGFTEWTNVRKAKPLYNNHAQPISPLNNNYYDLMRKDVMEWQFKLAKDYDVFGFCFYHYWLNGRLILEKPAENLLQWYDIQTNYCFCWANHSWKKTWNGTKELLIEQEYGDETEWEKHFNYLLPFFKDERYIKVDNKPLFMIYLPIDIKDLDTRVKYYNQRCISAGFDGLFFVESFNHNKYHPVSELSSAVAIREPSVSLSMNNPLTRFKHRIKSNPKYKMKIFPMKYKYNSLIQNSVKFAEKLKVEKRIFLGAFTGWDSTPRHGRNGYVVEKNTAKQFHDYLISVKLLTKRNKEDFIFLNAWNEWAEGMYLEPDSQTRYSKLETIKNVNNTVDKSEYKAQ